MKFDKSPRTDQHPSCTGSVLPVSRILLQSTESTGQKEVPCKTHSDIFNQTIYIPLPQLLKLFMCLELFIYLSQIYSSYLCTFQTAYSNKLCIQVTSISFKKIILENNLYFSKQFIHAPL